MSLLDSKGVWSPLSLQRQRSIDGWTDTQPKNALGGSRFPNRDLEGPLMDSDTQAPSGALAAHTADRAPNKA